MDQLSKHARKRFSRRGQPEKKQEGKLQDGEGVLVCIFKFTMNRGTVSGEYDAGGDAIGSAVGSVPLSVHRQQSVPPRDKTFEVVGTTEVVHQAGETPKPNMLTIGPHQHFSHHDGPHGFDKWSLILQRSPILQA